MASSGNINDTQDNNWFNYLIWQRQTVHPTTALSRYRGNLLFYCAAHYRGSCRGNCENYRNRPPHATLKLLFIADFAELIYITSSPPVEDLLSNFAAPFLRTLPPHLSSTTSPYLQQRQKCARTETVKANILSPAIILLWTSKIFYLCAFQNKLIEEN